MISTHDSLSDHLARAMALIDTAVTEAAAKVVAGPDNPAVRRVGGAGKVNAFFINFTEIGKSKGAASWEPFSHDWCAQYEFAKELLVARKFAALRDLLAGGSYRDASRGKCSFAPEVIERIKTITGDLRAAVAMTEDSTVAPRVSRTARP